MTQYVSRRKRCWKLLKELDPDIELSEGHRADMLLDLAGLDKNERTMIQASINNERNFEKVSDALVCQHPRVHLNDKKKGNDYNNKGQKGKGKGKYKNKSKNHKYQPYWKKPSGTAFLGEQEDDGAEDENYDEEYDWEDSDGDAYEPNEDDDVEDDEIVDDALEACELDAIGFLADQDGYIPEGDTAIAEYIQAGATAFAAFKGKG